MRPTYLNDIRWRVDRGTVAYADVEVDAGTFGIMSLTLCAMPCTCRRKQLANCSCIPDATVSGRRGTPGSGHLGVTTKALRSVRTVDVYRAAMAVWDRVGRPQIARQDAAVSADLASADVGRRSLATDRGRAYAGVRRQMDGLAGQPNRQRRTGRKPGMTPARFGIVIDAVTVWHRKGMGLATYQEVHDELVAMGRPASVDTIRKAVTAAAASGLIDMEKDLRGTARVTEAGRDLEARVIAERRAAAAKKAKPSNLARNLGPRRG